MIYGGTERRSGRASKPIVVAEAPSAVARGNRAGPYPGISDGGGASSEFFFEI